MKDVVMSTPPRETILAIGMTMANVTRNEVTILPLCHHRLHRLPYQSPFHLHRGGRETLGAIVGKIGGKILDLGGGIVLGKTMVGEIPDHGEVMILGKIVIGAVDPGVVVKSKSICKKENIRDPASALVIRSYLHHQLHHQAVTMAAPRAESVL